MAIKNQRQLRIPLVGAVMVMGVAQFDGTDTSGELSAGGLLSVKSLDVTPIQATATAQTAGMGAVAATAYIDITLPRVRGSVGAIKITAANDVATSDVNYWTIGVVNRGTDGSGVAVVVDNTNAANSTKATGGTALTGGAARTATLTGVANDKVVTEGQVLRITLTRVGAGAALGAVSVEVDITGAAIGGDEQIFLAEPLSGPDAAMEVTVPATGTLTLARTGASPSNNLAFSYRLIGY